MSTIGEALVKFSSDATSTLKAMQSVSDGAKDANEKGSAALDTFKKKMGESVDASKEFTKVFLEGAAVVGVAAIGFAVKSVEAYNEHEQALTQMNAALKSTGAAAGQSAKQITDHAEALQHSTGASRDAIMAGQNMLLTFTEIKGKTFPETTQAVLDMATAMNGGMLPNAEQMREKALQMGKALNDPIHGFNMLKREGVTFSEAQKETIKAMEATHDVAKQQDIMLKELAREFGGSAEAAGGTFAGQLAKAKNALNDVMVAVGKLIVDHLTPLVNKFNEWFEKAGGVDGVMQKLTISLKNAANWIEHHRTVVIALAGAIAGPLVVSFLDAAAGALAFMIELAPVLIIGAAVALVIYEVYTHFQFFKKYINEAKEAGVAIWGFMKDSLWPILSEGFHIIGEILLPAIQQLGQVIIQQLWPALQQLWATLEPILLPVLKVIGGIIGVYLVVQIALLVAAFFIVINAIKYVIEVVTDAIHTFDNLIDGIKKVISGNFAAGFKEIGQSMMDALIAPIKPALDWIEKRIKDLLNSIKNIPGVGAITGALHDLHIPGFASGVKNFSGGLAVVGENGPELVKLPSGSDVIPNHEVGKQLATTGSNTGSTGGSSTNVVANVGIFLGTPGEFRSFAERIQVEINRLTSARGN